MSVRPENAFENRSQAPNDVPPEAAESSAPRRPGAPPARGTSQVLSLGAPRYHRRVAETRSESALLEAWRAGDPDAGEIPFARYFDCIFRFVASKAPSEAADLVQATFLAAAESRERMAG